MPRIRSARPSSYAMADCPPATRPGASCALGLDRVGNAQVELAPGQVGGDLVLRRVRQFARDNRRAWMRGGRVGASSSVPFTRPFSHFQVNSPERAPVGVIGPPVSQAPA